MQDYLEILNLSDTERLVLQHDTYWEEDLVSMIEVSLDWAEGKDKDKLYWDFYNYHRDYNFGTKNEYVTSDAMYHMQNDINDLKEEDKNYIFIPVYMHDHGDIALSLKPFGCRWDSFQVGFIVIYNPAYGKLDEYKKSIQSSLSIMSLVYQGRVYSVSKQELVQGKWEFIDTIGGFVSEDGYTKILNTYTNILK